MLFKPFISPFDKLSTLLLSYLSLGCWAIRDCVLSCRVLAVWIILTIKVIWQIGGVLLLGLSSLVVSLRRTASVNSMPIEWAKGQLFELWVHHAPREDLARLILPLLPAGQLWCFHIACDRVSLGRIDFQLVDRLQRVDLLQLDQLGSRWQDLLSMSWPARAFNYLLESATTISLRIAINNCRVDKRRLCLISDDYVAIFYEFSWFRFITFSTMRPPHLTWLARGFFTLLGQGGVDVDIDRYFVSLVYNHRRGWLPFLARGLLSFACLFTSILMNFIISVLTIFFPKHGSWQKI